MTKVVVTTEAK